MGADAAGRAAAPAAALAAALAAAAGCSTGLHYRPDAPVLADAPAPDVGEVELLEISRQPVMQIRFRWRAPVGVGLAGGFLAPPEAMPCAAGVAATAIEVDGQTRWDRPVGLGADHVVTFTFPFEEQVSTGSLFADVDVTTPGGDRRCLRFPVAGASGRLHAVAPLRALTAAVAVAAPMRVPSDEVLAVEIGIGHWVGPVRLTIAGGVAAGSSRLSLGGVTQSDVTDILAGYVIPQATVFLPAGTRHALGLSAGYLVGGARAKTSGATAVESDDALLGPRLALEVLTIYPPLVGAPRAPLVGGGMVLSLARQSLWPGQRERGVAYVVGVGLMIGQGGGGWW